MDQPTGVTARKLPTWSVLVFPPFITRTHRFLKYYMTQIRPKKIKIAAKTQKLHRLSEDFYYYSLSANLCLPYIISSSPLLPFPFSSKLNPSLSLSLSRSTHTQNLPKLMSKEDEDLRISKTPPSSPETPPEMDTLASQLLQLDVPKPLECLQGNPIPPFLSKTYELVDDRSLDPIISWGRKGESFVVWDPVEFSRIILPRNFKHNNFSSFVRQLNTYGFRKIDTNRWEFANEAFRRGEKHLLRNIQRRKGPHSQQVGSSGGSASEMATFGLESEVEGLRNERSMMMQEVVELQQQQRGTVHHMESVHQRLQAAEQRQKQMISFLAKLFQNPAFIARLKENKAQREIDSPRTRRKFVKHQPPEPGQSESPIDGQIVKFQPEFIDTPSVVPNLAPAEQSPDYVLQGMIDMDLAGEANPFNMGNVSSDEFALKQEFAQSRHQVHEGTSSFGVSGHLLDQGKNVLIPLQEDDPGYFVSFPEDLAAEKSFPEFSGIENIVKQEDIWSMGFENSAGIPTSGSELWGNPANYDAPELATSSSFSDIWDLDSGQGAGSSGVHKWSADETPLDEFKGSADLPEDRPKDFNP